MSINVIPHLTCRKADDAIEFYKKAFGAEEAFVQRLPDGRVMHGAVTLSGTPIYLVEEFEEFGGKSPLALGGTGVTIHLQVPDVDAFFAQAVEAGCTVIMPLAVQFWGDKYGSVQDPFGHRWSMATTVEAKTPEELAAAFASYAGEDSAPTE